MLTIAVLDMISLTYNSLVVGFLDLFGTHFCQYPVLIYLNGAFATCVWMTDCLACILLAIERCVKVNSKLFLSFLFGKRMFSVVMALTYLYGLYSFIFTIPAIYTSEYSCYLFDPLLGKDVRPLDSEKAYFSPGQLASK
ncbi:hypothetical protein CRE_08842 [Caenorhabditis remanei]|uniref:G-protein coupled receptors family 1 profile domain-containing protein n=1 Tax=Caenorhabditis remanei TaxID=31234 RepID=E3LHT7_CAERE|nr:hypothetical protein CRE_08842 [Caenorhabditis remanei]